MQTGFCAAGFGNQRLRRAKTPCTSLRPEGLSYRGWRGTNEP